MGETMHTEIRPKGLVSNQAGKTETWVMLLCLIGVGAYLKIGRELFSEHLSPIYHILIVATLIVVTLFTLGCVLNLIVLGDKSKRDQIKDLQKQLAELRSYVDASRGRIGSLEGQTKVNRKLMKPRSVECLLQANRILNAMERRTVEIEQLAITKKTLDLIDAYGLLQSDLVITEDCTNALITANPIPPLSPNEWFKTVDALLGQVDNELERLAA